MNNSKQKRRSDAKFNSDKERYTFHNKIIREQKIEKDNKIISLEKQLTLYEYNQNPLNQINRNNNSFFC